jgi:hypothetical protein
MYTPKRGFSALKAQLIASIEKKLNPKPGV